MNTTPTQINQVLLALVERVAKAAWDVAGKAAIVVSMNMPHKDYVRKDGLIADITTINDEAAFLSRTASATFRLDPVGEWTTKYQLKQGDPLNNLINTVAGLERIVNKSTMIAPYAEEGALGRLQRAQGRALKLIAEAQAAIKAEQEATLDQASADAAAHIAEIDAALLPPFSEIQAANNKPEIDA